MKVGRRAISTAVAAIVVIVVVIGAAAGVFFLYGSGSKTTSQGTSSTSTSTLSSTISTTSSTTTSSSTSTSSSTTTTSGTQNYYLPYNNQTNTVRFELVMLNNITESGGVNYNATNFGAMIIYVPAGSNLNVTLDNLESIPHNLVLVKNNTNVPNADNVGTDGQILFAIATTTTGYLFNGMKAGVYNGTYTGIAAGTYWLACGINKHAGAGLWVDLVASATVQRPYVLITSPALKPSGFS